MLLLIYTFTYGDSYGSGSQPTRVPLRLTGRMRQQLKRKKKFK